MVADAAKVVAPSPEGDNVPTAGGNPAPQEELVKLLAAVEDWTYYFRNAYFWSPPSVANARRRYEKQHSWSEVLEIVHETPRTRREFIIKVSCEVSCSCRNIYVYKSITINGFRVNLTKFRGFVKKVLAGKSIPRSYIPPLPDEA